MKGCFKVFLCVVVGVPATIAALIAIGIWWHSSSVRYRLTLVVEADGRQYTGSGVLQAECEDTEWFFSGLGGSSCRASGEAIPVNLGARGLLFVTLHGEQVSRDVNTSPAYLPWFAFPDAGRDAEGHRFYVSELRALARDKAKADLDFSLLPMLVRFRKPSDPKSVEKVSPYHLNESFGPGVKLVKATIAITDDSVSTGITKVLPWTSWMRTALDGSFYNDSTQLSNVLDAVDFKKD